MLSIVFGSHLEFSCVDYDYNTYFACFNNFFLCFTRSYILHYISIYYKPKRQCFQASLGDMLRLCLKMPFSSVFGGHLGFSTVKIIPEVVDDILLQIS